MSRKLHAPRGTADVLPEQAPARRAVEEAARRVLGAAGYARVETPLFEATELFARGVGESTDIVQKEMFTFEDGGGRSLTLRPEGTAPVARAYVEHGMHKLPQPVKLWYLGPFFRAERPQQGRYRQFWQVGAEVIGSGDPAVDAEIIVLLQSLLDTLEVRDTHLRVASLGTPVSRAEYRSVLTEYLQAHADRLSHDVRTRIDLNPLRAFDADDQGTREVMAGAPRLADFLDDDDREHFATVCELLNAAGLRYDVDHTLVRGLDYYTRTIFEFTSGVLGAQSAVGGGGRYDGLVELLDGPPTPGCGFAAGVERMLLAATQRPAPDPVVDLFVAWEEGTRTVAFALAAEARTAALGAQMDLAGRSRKGQLKQADRVGARFVAIVSQEDTVLKDMETGEQEDVATAEVVAKVLRGRGIG